VLVAATKCKLRYAGALARLPSSHQANATSDDGLSTEVVRRTRAICARLAEGRGNPLPLWQRLARGGLDVVKVDGDHVAMKFEADVGRVADALDRALNRVASDLRCVP
jgi:thioesterase domain-containing protein